MRFQLYQKPEFPYQTPQVQICYAILHNRKKSKDYFLSLLFNTRTINMSVIQTREILKTSAYHN